MVSEVKESNIFFNCEQLFSDLWTLFGLFKGHYGQFQVSLKLFFLRGELPGYRHTQVAEIYIDTHLMKGERKERSGYRQDPVISVVHRDITLTVKGKEYRHQYNPYGKRKRVWGTQGPDRQQADRTQPRQAQTLTRWAGKTRRASTDPHLAGRDPHPLGHQPGHQGRAGIGQGDLPHTREATSTLRMQGGHKEQHGSHSLNRWKERFAL